MVDILHRVGIASSTQDHVYEALTTLEGLSGWWASDTHGNTTIGGVLQFRFEAGGIDMRVLELDPAKHVLWHGEPEVIGGNRERCAGPARYQDRQLELTNAIPLILRCQRATSDDAGRGAWA